MSRHYLLYWKLKKVEYRFYGEPLSVLTRKQLEKAGAGDTVWIVTIRGGDLFLVGRMVVGHIDKDSESSSVRVMAADGTASTLRLINLTELSITMSLRFESSADRLRVNRKGRLNALSLYHVRQLTDDSGSLLNYIWDRTTVLPPSLETVEVEDDPFIYLEGQEQVQRRVIRQRSSRLVNQAKARFVEEHGDLCCEICGMSFAAVYGELGEGYIEAHHVEPISEVDGETFTDIDGIVLVCANCHRMIHRRSPPYSIDYLREHIGANQRNKPKAYSEKGRTRE
jgi:predicted HNH restriction endonuclease